MLCVEQRRSVERRLPLLPSFESYARYAKIPSDRNSHQLRVEPRIHTDDTDKSSDR